MLLVIRHLAIGAFAVSLLGCQSTAAPAFAGRSVVASAPAGILDSQLGTPFDARFFPLHGNEASTLFPDAEEPRRSTLNQMRHEHVLVDTEETFAANATGWGFLTADASLGTEWRHASYRAMSVAYVSEIDDATEMREPPLGAVYYLSRIYYGRSYELVFSGRARDFHAGIRAQLFALGAGAEMFVQQHRLTTKAAGRGLTPRDGSAIFAKDPAAIERAYEGSGPVVPIVVEFRQIPNTRALASPIAWAEPIRVELRIGNLSVASDGTMGATPWNLSLTCQANGGNPFFTEQLWAGSTNDRGVYPITRSWPLELLPGDRAECSVRGTYSGFFGAVKSLPPASAQVAIPTSAASALSGAMHGQDDDVAYTVDFFATRIP
jgi:hypothetical protein